MGARQAGERTRGFRREAFPARQGRAAAGKLEFVLSCE